MPDCEQARFLPADWLSIYIFNLDPARTSPASWFPTAWQNWFPDTNLDRKVRPAVKTRKPETDSLPHEVTHVQKAVVADFFWLQFPGDGGQLSNAGSRPGGNDNPALVQRLDQPHLVVSQPAL